MPVVLDPFDRNTLYVTSIDHFYSGDTLLGSVWVSHERGDDRYEWDGERTIHINSWSQLGNPVGGYMQTLCCAPLVPGRLYAGSDHAVHRYDPADSTWRNVTGNLPDRWSNRVVASPHEPDGVYVVLGTWGIPHVWHSTNAGEAWIDISSNLPDASCNDLFIDPRDENTLFLATDIGLFMTNNGGVSWNNFGNGLPNVRCEDFDWQPAAGLLRVGTHGRGVWEIYLGSNDLELLYPNGVADLIVGEQLPIRWSGSDFGGDVRIEINRSFPEGVWEPILDSTPNDGVEDWTVSGANGAHVRLRITHLSRADLSDTTNADAQLGAPWLNFTFPLPGREAIAGVYVTVPIQFGFLPGHDLEFYLNTDYPVGEWKWVSRTYSTHSTAQLSLSYALPSTHARLRGQVERVGQAPVILYMSNSDFTIREPYVNILSPRPGDTLYIGEQVNISAACDPEITRIYLDLQRIGADPEFVSLNDVFNGDDVSLTSALWTVTGPEWEHCRITANVGPGYTFVSPGEFVIAGPRDRSNIAGIPSEFNIGQPYPNPFNSRCSFSLELPQTGNVVARVYNRLGQEVATLFDGPLNAGYQHVTFDGSGMASGIYFIQVETPDLRRVLKVALIR
jgi:hypothetical protein